MTVRSVPNLVYDPLYDDCSDDSDYDPGYDGNKNKRRNSRINDDSLDHLTSEPARKRSKLNVEEKQQDSAANNSVSTNNRGIRTPNKIHILKEDIHCLSDFSQLFETGIGQLNTSGMSCMKGRF